MYSIRFRDSQGKHVKDIERAPFIPELDSNVSFDDEKEYIVRHRHYAWRRRGGREDVPKDELTIYISLSEVVRV